MIVTLIVGAVIGASIQAWRNRRRKVKGYLR